jgi:hypothetical protein
MATRTFTHLYDTPAEARQTVHALQQAGVPQNDISLVSNNAESSFDPAEGEMGAASGDHAETTGAGTGATIGTVLGGGAGLLAGIGALAIPGVGPVVAAGWLVAALTGAGVGAAGGGLLGTLVGSGVPEEHAHTYVEGVRRGGTLVSVRADEAMASTVENVLNGRTSVDVTNRQADYKSEGWNRHDETAPAYTAEQVKAERSRRVRVY